MIRFATLKRLLKSVNLVICKHFKVLQKEAWEADSVGLGVGRRKGAGPHPNDPIPWKAALWQNFSVSG